MYARLQPLLGNPPMSTFGLVNDGATPRLMDGTLAAAYDPWWGHAEFVYARAGGTITQYAPCTCLPAFNAGNSRYRWNMSEVANTAGMGVPLFVAMVGMSSGDYGWFMRSGLTPVDCNASVAADTALAIAAAGQLGALGNGKQILNARVAAAATTTVAKAAVGVSGSTRLVVTNGADGWFPGVYLSGTGIAGGTTVTAIDPDGRGVTVSAALTAAVNGTVTATYNNATVFYNVVLLDRPFTQGQIV